MLKKYTALLFLFIAYAILLGHSIIPHHHHDNHHDLAEHHASNHHHTSSHHAGDGDSEDLSHLFSHFVHPADGFTITTNQSISNTFSKQLVLLVAILPADFLLTPCDIPPLFDRPPSEHLNYSFSNTCTFGLRAPPAFIV
ncbi:MAG TPA: hypothetical protein VJY62_11065 [Bacteroidia bacterium]|nr:hypothetical protein [Bacteroidia bacterium]